MSLAEGSQHIVERIVLAPCSGYKTHVGQFASMELKLNLGCDLTCNRSTRMRSERESPTKDGPSTGVSFALSQVDLRPKHGSRHVGNCFFVALAVDCRAWKHA